MMNLKELKEYLQKPYESSQSFLENVIFPVFGEDNFEDAGRLNMLKAMPELKPKAEASGITSILNLGGIYVEGSQLDIFDVTINSKRQLARSRVDIQELVRRIISSYSGAFMIFHYKTIEGHWDWRFTFCKKGANQVDSTDAKRYTFLLGPGQSCRTAADNFIKLHAKIEREGEFDIDDIVAAFDVEALSKEFFKKYKEHYERFCTFVYDHKNDTEWFGSEFNQWEEKIIRDYVKKLLGRIVFLHFLQKKGWMGVPADKKWGDGDTEFMRNLYLNASDEQKDNYLDRVLEPLFSEALDTDRTKYNDLFDTGVEGFRNVKIPYLNGGLFERDALDKPNSRFPANYFEDLFEFFYQYNFTIDENDPNDAQVGVDPEMLGMIFENLLEDNKDKGAFYTPKEIVQYMCKESLIAYLQTDVADDATKEAIRQFVTTYDVEVLGGRDSELAGDIDQLLLDVKICDPAIGSGAFPMGLLKELFYCRGAINDYANAANIKKHIIQHNIYGVDIERGAVDIARLRFWLALIVDEETPHALPNMDFKIMQGNSLLEQYKGFDLSTLVSKKSSKEGAIQLTMFEDDIDVLRRELSAKINLNYNCSDHALRHSIRENIKQTIQHQIDVQHININLDEVDVFGNQDFFLWHTFFSEVFDKGGFDIVIGNPPYIQLQANEGFLSNLYQNKGFETFNSTGDIFSLFYELGWNLLKVKGNLCFITSNKWMRNASGFETRNFLTSRTNPKLIFDFAGIQLFENATVETNIIIFSKDNNAMCTLAVTTDAKTKEVLDNLEGYANSHFSIMSFVGSEDWIILSKVEADIQRKISKIAIPLKEWEIEINFGIKTGYNTAFIIDTIQRHQILSRCTSEEEKCKSEKLIVPVIRGRDTKRYRFNWDNLWIINTHNGLRGEVDPVDINELPSIKSHLDIYWNKISTRSDKGGTPYNLRNCAYLHEFSKPKIIWGEISDRSKFCYDEEGRYYCEATTFFMTGEISVFLLCYLNSKLSEYLFSKIATRTGMGTTRWKKYKIEKLLVPHLSKDIEKQIESIYRVYIESKDESLLSEIDQIIYKFYNLTPEEIAIVEGRNE